LSRVIVGARDILEIAPVATLLGTVVGTTIGLAQGYFGGAVDMIVGRIVDAAPVPADRDRGLPLRRRRRPEHPVTPSSSSGSSSP
jgi:hypothetical protein